MHAFLKPRITFSKNHRDVLCTPKFTLHVLLDISFRFRRDEACVLIHSELLSMLYKLGLTNLEFKSSFK